MFVIVVVVTVVVDVAVGLVVIMVGDVVVVGTVAADIEIVAKVDYDCCTYC